MSKLDELLGIDRTMPDDVLGMQLAYAQEKLIDDLIALRKEKGLTQDDVAERMDRSQSNVCKMESLNSNPTLSSLRRYALAIGANITFCVTDHDSSHGWVASSMRPHADRGPANVQLSTQPETQQWI